MAKQSYDVSLTRLLQHEGGYTNHPADPGGPTNFGITIYDYRKYVRPGATAADVKAMNIEDAKAIYRAKYWDAQRCDELPAGIDYAVFDYGVNSGIGRSKKVLQRVVGVAADGMLGPQTMRAAATCDPETVIIAICDERLRFLKALRTWPVFGKGWQRRVIDVRAVSLTMAAHAATVPETLQSPTTGKAPKEAASASTVAASGAIGAAGAVVAGASASLNGWQIGLLAVVVFMVAAIAVHFVSKKD